MLLLLAALPLQILCKQLAIDSKFPLYCSDSLSQIRVDGRVTKSISNKIQRVEFQQY